MDQNINATFAFDPDSIDEYTLAVWGGMTLAQRQEADRFFVQMFGNHEPSHPLPVVQSPGPSPSSDLSGTNGDLQTTSRAGQSSGTGFQGAAHGNVYPGSSTSRGGADFISAFGIVYDGSNPYPSPLPSDPSRPSSSTNASAALYATPLANQGQYSAGATATGFSPPQAPFAHMFGDAGMTGIAVHGPTSTRAARDAPLPNPLPRASYSNPFPRGAGERIPAPRSAAAQAAAAFPAHRNGLGNGVRQFGLRTTEQMHPNERFYVELDREREQIYRDLMAPLPPSQPSAALRASHAAAAARAEVMRTHRPEPPTSRIPGPGFNFAHRGPEPSPSRIPGPGFDFAPPQAGQHARAPMQGSYGPGSSAATWASPPTFNPSNMPAHAQYSLAGPSTARSGGMAFVPSQNTMYGAPPAPRAHIRAASGDVPNINNSTAINAHPVGGVPAMPANSVQPPTPGTDQTTPAPPAIAPASGPQRSQRGPRGPRRPRREPTSDLDTQWLPKFWRDLGDEQKRRLAPAALTAAERMATLPSGNTDWKCDYPVHGGKCTRSAFQKDRGLYAHVIDHLMKTLGLKLTCPRCGAKLSNQTTMTQHLNRCNLSSSAASGSGSGN